MKKQSLIAVLFFCMASYSAMAAAGPADSVAAGPIQLLSFTGTLSNEAGKIHWVTEDERGLQSFTIERSDNGRDFYPIAIMPAMNEKGQLLYEYVDKAVSKTTPAFSYRLKITYTDNKEGYSPLIFLYADNKKNQVCYTAKNASK
jgi:hypothetical protein